MADFPYGALTQSLIGLGQALHGAAQKKKLVRPEYDIPQEFQQNVSLAQGVKTRGMDATSMALGKQQVNRSAMLGLQQLSNRRGSTAGIGAIARNMQDAGLNLAARDAAMRQQNFITGTQMEMGANTALAGQKIQQWDWNKRSKYVTAMNEANAKIAAGWGNIMGGAQAGMQMQMVDKMYSPTATQDTSTEPTFQSAQIQGTVPVTNTNVAGPANMASKLMPFLKQLATGGISF